MELWTQNMMKPDEGEEHLTESTSTRSALSLSHTYAESAASCHNEATEIN